MRRIIIPAIYNIQIKDEACDIDFVVDATPKEMRELAADLLRNASMQEALQVIRKIHKELPKAYTVIGEYALAKIYVEGVPIDGLDVQTWNELKAKIEKAIEE